MGCCLLAAFLVAGVRRAWFALVPDRRPTVATFAPAASRPAPGQPATAVLPAPEAPLRRVGLPLVGAATVGAYALLTWALALAGLLRTSQPLGRDVVLALLLAAGLLVAFSSRPSAARGGETGLALAFAGIAWTGVSLVDMHLLGGIEVAGAATAVELLVHGTGLALLSAGVAVLRAPVLVRRLEGVPT